MKEVDLARMRHEALDRVRHCEKFEQRTVYDSLDPAHRDYLAWCQRLAQVEALVTISGELAQIREHLEKTGLNQD
ncbi:hypothetical protein [Mycobacteroides franklinii]|uniref:Uncharacterized protein n=1 Tax=Mycobacteroides franklinii TaxID=948102 RepID=A0A4R5P8J9_9MYCO|nr:hypothetical protein [Mycobacteroides franklinii]TDH19431.1 hypothetical protein EJ571_23095 [Mycobacteroides franklinii]TDZ42164.1 hypothetical protein CCUG64054_02204 [Mycobacteroides franklinii]TDZ52312.1 hypothetical protein CCUG63697_00789 [Mycobacteroides franklinii]TDZ55719.1 hypothetical protein CCUG63696_02206 [Mycobacteroides franklinii]TDZ62660.1 hypothetical protein CCUG63695_02131 [Mycobacteroides franklinii]